MKRVVAILILSLMIVSFVAPFLGGSKEKNKTDVAAQEESTEQKEEQKEEVVEKSEQEIAQEEYNAKLASLNQMNLSKEDWFREYKILVEEYSYILNKPETIYDKFTKSELDLLFRVVQAEIGSEYSFEQKCNVVSVIYNRIRDDRFGNSINEVLVGHQFSTISNGAIYRVNIDEKTTLACEYVYMFGDTTNGSLFFDSNGSLRYSFVFNDGAHNFYTKR